MFWPRWTSTSTPDTSLKTTRMRRPSSLPAASPTRSCPCSASTDVSPNVRPFEGTTRIRRCVAVITAEPVGKLADIDDPGCREFQIGDGDWPFRGFVVRRGDDVYAYQNFCVHVGHPLNWAPDSFLTKDRSAIICASHGATYEIETGYCYAGPGSGRSLRSDHGVRRAG